MKLPNRSPGYLLEEQTEKMRWPNLELVEPLADISKSPFGDECCRELELALGTPKRERVQKALINLSEKYSSGDEIDQINLDFLKRFMVEYDREQEALKNRREKLDMDSLSAKGRQLAVNSFYVDNITEEKIALIRSNMASEINRFINNSFQPVRTFRNYDRSISWKSGGNIKLIDGLLREIGAVKAAEEYFGFPMCVGLVTLHVSMPDDVHFKQVLSDKSYTPKTCGLHYDPKSSQIKAIIYLKCVSDKDGPFSCVPQSHNYINPPLERLSGKANSTVNYLDSDSARKAFMRLPERMRKTSIFGTITDDADELSAELLQNERRFLSSDGNAIIFDPSSFHRGGICAPGGQRVSLQVVIRKK